MFHRMTNLISRQPWIRNLGLNFSRICNILMLKLIASLEASLKRSNISANTHDTLRHLPSDA